MSTEDKFLAALSHVSFFFCPIILPLVVFLLKKDSLFVRDHAREALVFHLFTIVAGLICGILSIIIIGTFLAIALGFFSIIFTIIAIVKAIDGSTYAYPLTSQWAQKL